MLNLKKPEHFKPSEHIIDVHNASWEDMYDNYGNALPGIKGRPGSVGITLEGKEIGAEIIRMRNGSEFPLHLHEGSHILYCLKNAGSVHINGQDYPFEEGHTIFIPAQYPHGVGTLDSDDFDHFDFMAFGYPHNPVSSLCRMELVEGMTEEESRAFWEKHHAVREG